MRPGNSDNSDLFGFLESLRKRRFDRASCFLCGRSSDALHLTEEHVIPRWAQNRYELWNQRLTLLNGTTIPYRHLTVPCCEDCNTQRLQPIETAVSNAVLNGSEAVRQLGDKLLFLWLGKIFYGMLYRELFLLSDRADPSSPSIVTVDGLQRCETHLIFLQQAREQVETVGFCPASIFVFRAQKPANVHLQWDFCDNFDTLCIGIRMGDVAMAAALADGGAQKLQNVFEDVSDLPLHRLQFREVFAVVSYLATLATRTPKYITIEGSPHKSIQLPLGGFSLKPLFEGWDNDIYARYLAHYTGLALHEIHLSSEKVATFLYGPDGKPHQMAPEEI